MYYPFAASSSKVSKEPPNWKALLDLHRKGRKSIDAVAGLCPILSILYMYANENAFC